MGSLRGWCAWRVRKYTTPNAGVSSLSSGLCLLKNVPMIFKFTPVSNMNTMAFGPLGDWFPFCSVWRLGSLKTHAGMCLGRWKDGEAVSPERRPSELQRRLDKASANPTGSSEGGAPHSCPVLDHEGQAFIPPLRSGSLPHWSCPRATSTHCPFLYCPS